MATNKKLDEQIANMRDEIRQKENRIKELIQKKKQEERKARTRRLIERGAILESVIDGADMLTNKQVQSLVQTAIATPAARDVLAGFFAAGDGGIMGGDGMGNDDGQMSIGGGDD